MSLQEKLIEWYLDHKADFLDKYEGKHLLINLNKEVSVFNTEREAINAGIERFGLGKFIAHKCQKEEPWLECIPEAHYYHWHNWEPEPITEAYYCDPQTGQLQPIALT